jgi:hypothetical protein
MNLAPGLPLRQQGRADSRNQRLHMKYTRQHVSMEIARGLMTTRGAEIVTRNAHHG